MGRADIKTEVKMWKNHLINLHLSWSGSLLLPVERKRGEILDTAFIAFIRNVTDFFLVPFLADFGMSSLIFFTPPMLQAARPSAPPAPAPPTRTRLATLDGRMRAPLLDKPHPQHCSLIRSKVKRWLLETQHWMRFVLGVWLSSRPSMAEG